MSLFVRHCAWLNAVPEKSEGSKSKKKNIPRREKIKNDLELEEDESLEMPEVVAIHMISYLFEVGPSLVGGMSAAPLTHSEIEAWQRNTGIELSSWEARTLKRMSVEYVNELAQATDRHRPAPWEDAPYARPDLALVARRMREDMESL